MHQRSISERLFLSICVTILLWYCASIRVHRKDNRRGPNVLVLKADAGVVVRGGIPQAAARDLDSLIFHLPDRDLHNDLITRDVHRCLTLLLDLIGNALAHCLAKRENK